MTQKQNQFIHSMTAVVLIHIFKRQSSELKGKQIIKIYHTIRSKYSSLISVFQWETTVAHGITDNTSDPIIDNICF